MKFWKAGASKILYLNYYKFINSVKVIYRNHSLRNCRRGAFMDDTPLSTIRLRLPFYIEINYRVQKFKICLNTFTVEMKRIYTPSILLKVTNSFLKTSETDLLMRVYWHNYSSVSRWICSYFDLIHSLREIIPNMIFNIYSRNSPFNVKKVFKS